jgi:hypothetical protein
MVYNCVQEASSFNYGYVVGLPDSFHNYCQTLKMHSIVIPLDEP